MASKVNLSYHIGEKFNRWTIIEHIDNEPGRRKVRCVCDCGNTKVVTLTAVKNGYSKSCGCLTKEINASSIVNRTKTHGESKTRLYAIWRGIKQRCYNECASGYQNYGGKGILVCDEWKDSYETFKKWSLDTGYEDELEIDRIDSNGNYEPSNCRWVTKSFNISQSNKSGLKNKSRFNKDDVSEMKRLRENGHPYSCIANKFNTSTSHVSRLVKNEVKNLLK